jgi:hypothetical protein
MPVNSQTLIIGTIIVIAIMAIAYYLFLAGSPGAGSPGAGSPVAGPSVAGAVASIVKHFSGCENDTPKVLTCPAGTVIKDGTVKYGRWDNNVCPHATVSSTTASKFKTYPLPPKYIGGQTADISGTMNLSVGNDPYPNVYKQVEIDYTCA